MPIYVYECTDDKCGLGFEIEQRIKAKTLKKCPGCEKRTLERIIQPSLIFVKEVKTIKQQAEKNGKRMGKYWVEDSERKQKKEQTVNRERQRREMEAKLPAGAKLAEQQEHKPWYGKLPNKVKRQTDSKKINKYIMTGEE